MLRKREIRFHVFSFFLTNTGGINYPAVLLMYGFAVLRAIYRSRVQLLKVIYSQFGIKSIIYQYISMQYRPQGFKTYFFISGSLSCRCLKDVPEKHPRIIRFICSFRGVAFAFLFRVFETQSFTDTKDQSK